MVVMQAQPQLRRKEICAKPPAKGLWLPLLLRFGSSVVPVKGLADSGAECSIILGPGLIPPQLLSVAKCPLSLKGAQGVEIRGGSHGAVATISLSVVEGRDPKVYEFPPTFVIEAEVGPIAIIGYAFLKRYCLAIDCSSDCLRPAPKVRPKPVPQGLVTPLDTPTPKGCTTPTPTACSRVQCVDFRRAFGEGACGCGDSPCTTSTPSLVPVPLPPPPSLPLPLEPRSSLEVSSGIHPEVPTETSQVRDGVPKLLCTGYSGSEATNPLACGWARQQARGQPLGAEGDWQVFSLPERPSHSAPHLETQPVTEGHSVGPLAPPSPAPSPCDPLTPLGLQPLPPAIPPSDPVDTENSTHKKTFFSESTTPTPEVCEFELCGSVVNEVYFCTSGGEDSDCVSDQELSDEGYSSDSSADSEKTKTKTPISRPPDSFADGWGFLKPHGGTQQERLLAPVLPLAPEPLAGDRLTVPLQPPNSVPSAPLTHPQVDPIFRPGGPPIFTPSKKETWHSDLPEITLRNLRASRLDAGGQKFLRKAAAVDSLTPMERRAHRHTYHRKMRPWHTETYAVTPELREQIMEWAGYDSVSRADFVDCFADKYNHQFPKFFHKGIDAFTQNWGKGDMLSWINGPFSRMAQVVQKIILAGAKGVAIVPVWKAHSWFWSLGEVTLDWWDLPPEIPVFQDNSGRKFPQRAGWSTRVVPFDASAHEPPTPPSQTPETPPPHQPKTPYNRNIHSVIESDFTDPRCKEYREKLIQEFEDVFTFKLPSSVDPLDRGPPDISIHKISMKPDARPKKVPPFRALGLREAAMRALVQKFQDRGMLRPVPDGNSAWASRAFVVPKPGGKWRLVIDYRYLNTQILDENHPIPNMEDLLVKQGKHAIWTIFDLEDGFHQMHVHPDSRQYTTFVTPFGAFEWLVLPMGIKTAPSAFQKMVAYCLGDLTADGIPIEPYIDDILLGTSPDPDNPPTSLQPSCSTSSPSTPQPIRITVRRPEVPEAKSKSLGIRFRARRPEGCDSHPSQVSFREPISETISAIPVVSGPHPSEVPPATAPPPTPTPLKLPPLSIIEKHFHELRHVFLCLRRHKLTVKMEKCHMFQLRVRFLGHILEQGVRRPDPAKWAAIGRWHHEDIKTATAMKSFLGLAQWYSIYIKNFSEYAAPLSDALHLPDEFKSRKLKKPGPEEGIPQPPLAEVLADRAARQKERAKAAKKVKIVWTPKMIECFNALKNGILQDAFLQIPDPYMPFVMWVDACDYAVGGALEQEDPDRPGHWRPVAFFSKKLSGKAKKDSDGKNALGQIGWDPREKETYAILCGLIKFEPWIGNSQVTIKSDHQSIQWWHTTAFGSAPMGRRARWHQFFSKFSLEIVYVPGPEQVLGDVMSRWAYPASTAVTDCTMHGSVADHQDWDDYVNDEKKWADQQVTFLSSSLASLGEQPNPLLCTESRVRALKRQAHLSTLCDQVAAQMVPLRAPRESAYIRAGSIAKLPPDIAVLFRDWSAEYAACPHLKGMYAALLAGPENSSGERPPTQTFTMPRGHYLHKGVLRAAGKVLVPSSLQVAVIKACHTYSHGGIDKVCELVRRKYTLPGLTNLRYKVKEVIADCAVCAQAKPRTGKGPGGLHHWPIPEYPFSSLAMDFTEVDPCKVGEEVYDYIFVIV